MTLQNSSEINSKIHRFDIDGLRAFAVIFVFIYHLNQNWLPGGVLGVDIFFVLSGFLITQMILRLVEGGNSFFATAKVFYRNRILRIMPAYGTMILLTLVFGFSTLLPLDFQSLLKKAKLSISLVSNYTFKEDTSYFLHQSKFNPFLHTWSISTEMQIYLLWPVLTFLLFRNFRKTDRDTIPLSFIFKFTFIAVGLVGLAEYFVTLFPDNGYYNVVSRIYQPVIGSLAALITPIFQRNYLKISTLSLALASWLVFAFIIGYVFFFENLFPLPGLKTLWITIATGLILILNSVPGSVSKFLSFSVFVFLGHLSYSIYLYQWPVLILFKYFGFSIDSSTTIALVISTTVILSWFTYRFIETRFKKITESFSKALFFFLVLPVGTLWALGPSILIWKENYSPLPVKAKELHMMQTTLTEPGALTCISETVEIPEGHHCIFGKKDKPISAILWGDSHAHHHLGLIKKIAENNDFAGKEITFPQCAPIFLYEGAGTDCLKRNANVERFLENNSSIDRVFVSGYTLQLLNEKVAWHTLTKFRSQFIETIKKLKMGNRKVYILVSPPDLPLEKESCPVKQEFYKGIVTFDCSFTDRNFERHQDNLAFFKTLVPPNQIINIRDLFCKNERCDSFYKGLPIYMSNDQTHINYNFSSKIFEDINYTN